MLTEHPEIDGLEILTDELKAGLLGWETPGLIAIRESATEENISEVRDEYQAEAQKLDSKDASQDLLHASILFSRALMLKQIGRVEEYKDELLLDGQTDLYCALRYKFPDLAGKIFDLLGK